MINTKFFLFLRKTIYMFVIFAFFLFCASYMSVTAISEDKAWSPTVTLIGGTVEDDELIEITLTVKSVSGLCGMLAELSYDSDAFCFLSSDIEGDSYKLSLYDAGNCIRFLMEWDFEEKCETVIVRFYFTCVSDKPGAAIFSVALGDGESGAYFLHNGALECIPVDFSKAVTVVQYGDTEKNREEIWVNLREARILISPNGEKYIRVVGAAKGERVLAAGCKVFVTETRSGKSYGYYLVGVIGKESHKLGRPMEYERIIPIDEGKSYCFIITPIAYSRKSVFYGEKTVLFITKNKTNSNNSPCEYRNVLTPALMSQGVVCCK